jgi:hypothetical protein
MNKLIIIPLILVLAFACQKESEISVPQESEYMVFNQALECRPLETEVGFYLIALKDSVPWLVHLKTDGDYMALIDLANHLQTNYDSVQNLNICQLANGNIMMAYSYNDTTNGDTLSMVHALEVQQTGEIIDELNQPIPGYNNLAFNYVAISKNQYSNWVVISSTNNESISGLDVVSELIMQTTVYSTSDSEIEMTNTVQTLSNLSLYQSYTVANNNMVILMSEIQSGPPEQISTNSAYTVLTILPDGTSNQKILDDSFVSIDVVKQVNDGLILVGTMSTSLDESLLKIIAMDDLNNILWENSFTVSSSFTPTCIQVIDNLSILGGLSSDTREFSWYSIYEQTNNSLDMYAINAEGQMVWNNNQQTEFQSLIVGMCPSDEGYSWLLTKKSFNIYENIALIKTNSEGNLN